MNKKLFTTASASLALLAVCVAGSSLFLATAHAQAVTTKTVTATAKATAAQTRLMTIITRSDKAIDARIDALNKLNARIQELKNVSDTEKAAVSTDVQTNISGLTALRAKIDADTDATTALADEKTILGTYRIYALVIPQGSILAAADRATTIADSLTAVAGKLQTRLADASAAGKNVTALQTALTDLTAKVADAKTEAAAAQSAVASLVPDQGDKTKLAANHAALVAARAHIKTATQNLQAARKDAKTIVDGLKKIGDVKVKVENSASMKTDDDKTTDDSNKSSQ